jgi:hypothetical protein
MVVATTVRFVPTSNAAKSKAQSGCFKRELGTICNTKHKACTWADDIALVSISNPVAWVPLPTMRSDNDSIHDAIVAGIRAASGSTRSTRLHRTRPS